VAWRRGDMARAEAQAERALALQPGAPDALLTAGVARLRRGDVEGGLARLEAAARAAPDDATIRLNLGAALEVAGQGAAACRAYGAAQGLARDPGLRDEAARRLAARACPPSAP
jgi:tetratricopeptide (TPR) repeat protein